MGKRKRMIKHVELTEAQLTLLAQSMTPARKDEAQVYRGTEQGIMASVKSPAYARLPLHTIGKIMLLAQARNLETEYPEALRFLKTALTGVFTAEPVAKYVESQTDLYELIWADDKKSAAVDLLYLLQPRNMQVAPGFVLDLPVTVRPIGRDEFLIFHFNEGELREEEVGPPRPRKKKEDGVKKVEATKKEDGATKDDQSQAQRDTAASGENPTK
ncbi:MAG TPA: hypothetical protein VD973_05305 [Symbiobacteriaceae bacterium]|nr:hypothetical protein [Symbiobacteriaceae bacterium]